MKITDVKVQKVKNVNSRLKGIADITIDNAIAIHYIRIIEGDNGLFLAMPSRKTATGEYIDVCHPLDQIQEMLTKAILEEYERAEDYE